MEADRVAIERFKTNRRVVAASGISTERRVTVRRVVAAGHNAISRFPHSRKLATYLGLTRAARAATIKELPR